MQKAVIKLVTLVYFLIIAVACQTPPISMTEVEAVATVERISSATEQPLPTDTPQQAATLTPVPTKIAFTRTPTQIPTERPTQNPTLVPPTETPAPYPTNEPIDWILALTPEPIIADDVEVILRPNDAFNDVLLQIERLGKQYQYRPHTYLANQYAPKFGEPTIRVLDMDANGEPEVVLYAYGFGNPGTDHVTVGYYDAASDAYLFTDPVIDSIRVGVELKNIGAAQRWEIVTKRSGINWELSGGGIAEGLSAIKIMRFEQNQLVDVSAEYPTVVYEDAEHFIGLLENDPPAEQDWGYVGVEVPILGAYMSNMLILGREFEACERIEKLYEIRPNLIERQYLYAGGTCADFAEKIRGLLPEQ